MLGKFTVMVKKKTSLDPFCLALQLPGEPFNSEEKNIKVYSDARLQYLSGLNSVHISDHLGLCIGILFCIPWQYVTFDLCSFFFFFRAQRLLQEGQYG